MTVSYQYEVASSTSGGFTRLLFKWRGSLYKILYKELSLFAVAYITISLCYRFLFTEDQKRTFEKVSIYCDTMMNYIPLSFILGFYVSFVASRWWQQYIAIPWPDKMVHAIALHVEGMDEQGRILRRTLVRYLNLSLVLVLRSISSAVKKRFPTLDHLVDAGFITKGELEIFSTVPNTEFNTYWVPCTWFTALLKDAKTSRRIVDPLGVKHIMEEFSEYRQKCGLLWSYDWVSIPLVYTQVVTIATYAFFIASLVARQFVDRAPLPHKNGVDLLVPFFTLLQYFFYMGLLKVAEQLINPFGDDDEDFELNWIIDRHMKVSYLIVDTLLYKIPPINKDMFFDDECPQLPYTEASALFKKRTYRGSVADMIVPDKDQGMFLPEIQEEEEGIPIITKDGKIIYDIESGMTPSPNLTPRRGSGANWALHSKRRPASSGSKGIGSALLSVGLATCPEKIPDGDIVHDVSGKPLSDLDYFVFPVKDYSLDQSLNYEEEISRQHGKVSTSIKAKTGVKKKPVIKWKPYKKPTRLDEMQFVNSRDSTPPPGMFEEECAFMWRTIDIEDTDSVRTGTSSEDLRLHPESALFSPYNDPKRNTINSNRSSYISDYGSDGSRLRFSSKIRSCVRPSYLSNKLSHSWPQLHKNRCSHRYISSNLLKSISENSVFLDCLYSQLKSHHMNKLKRQSTASRTTSSRNPFNKMHSMKTPNSISVDKTNIS